jgi:transketolase
MIVARTVKGKGVSFMENDAGWHGKAPNAQQAGQALDELGAGS